MPKSLFETWRIGKDEVFIYTEHDSIAKILKEICGAYSITYQRGGKPYGWQFRLAKDKLDTVRRKMKDSLTIESK